MEFSHPWCLFTLKTSSWNTRWHKRFDSNTIFLDFSPTSIFDWIEPVLRRHSVKIFQDNGDWAPQNKPTFLPRIFWTRENMKLTDQMKAEIDSISKYVNGLAPSRPFIRTELIRNGGLTPNSLKYITENAESLGSHRVRLENLLCETDSKDRVHNNRLWLGMIHTVWIIRQFSV